MTTIYIGRVGWLTSWCDDPAARNRLCEVVAVGPSGTLAGDQVRVKVLEGQQPWETVVPSGQICPLTEAQQELRERHGMPHEFAQACWRAMGNLEITQEEAGAAIRNYAIEFREAGQ